MKSKLTIRFLKYLVITAVVIAAAYAVIWVILQGYKFAWTGLGDYTKPSSDFVRGKTLWDWIQLFIIPLVGSIGIFLLNRSEREIERQRAEQRSNLEREIATDQQRETALQSYLDKMSDLLLKEKLLAGENEVALDVARIRTITALRSLDKERKNIIFRFLIDSGLNGTKEPVVYLLQGASLNNIDLNHVSLTNINLDRADLQMANLVGAGLYKTNLVDANLSQTNLTNATIFEAELTGANLYRANLTSADIFESNLTGADLRDADLSGANLTGSSLIRANLNGADLRGANLTGVSLADAIVTQAQLATAFPYNIYNSGVPLDDLDHGYD